MASCVLPLISHLSPTLSPTHCLRYKCRDKNRNGVAWENAACDSRCSQLTWIKICQHQGPVRPQPYTQTLQWIRNNCLCVVAFLVFSKFWLIFRPKSDMNYCPCLLSHISWTSSRCALLPVFLMVWAPSQKVTWTHGRKCSKAKTWK